jgi:hypothetical protein
VSNRLTRWLVGPSEAELTAAYRRPAPQPIVSVRSMLPYPLIPPSMLSRQEALEVPVVSRARDLMAGFLGSLPLRAFTLVYGDTGPPVERDQIPPDWCLRLDPAKPKAFTVGGLVDDLIFFGVGYLLVLERWSTGYPKAFRWVPADEVVIQEMQGALYWTPTPRSGFYTGLGTTQILPFADVVQFDSPFVPLLANGEPAITTYRNLQAAVDRFSNVEVPTGVLRQTDGEPLTADERRTEAQTFTANRQLNSTAFLPMGVVYEAMRVRADELQLVEGRTFQSVELARLCNVPGALLDIAISSMTYSNQRDSLTNLWFFGLLPLATAMGQVFSGPNVTPRGTWIAFDPTLLIGQPDQWAGQNPAAAPAPPPDNVRPMPGSGPTGQVRQRPADTAAKG